LAAVDFAAGLAAGLAAFEDVLVSFAIAMQHSFLPLAGPAESGRGSGHIRVRCRHSLVPANGVGHIPRASTAIPGTDGPPAPVGANGEIRGAASGQGEREPPRDLGSGSDCPADGVRR
jgi:hypothetical protein